MPTRTEPSTEPSTEPPGLPRSLWQAGDEMSTHRSVPSALSVFARRRTYGELLWSMIGLPIGVAVFVFEVGTLSVSTGLVITFVGLPLLAATGLASRWIGAGVRWGANTVIGTAVPAPQRFRRSPGLFGWIGSCLKDGTAWRARLYLVLKLPLGILAFVVAVGFYVWGLGGISYPIWRPLLACNDSSDGQCHRGMQFGDGWTADTPGRIVLVVIAGLVLLLAAPWMVKLAQYPDRLAIRYLLGPTAGADRVEELERTRATAVDDSAAMLRRIERDLHDGAQAKLVAVAMNVGRARDKLSRGDDPEAASRLLDEAHTTAKQAITELRDLARGIHPPVLDAGLDAALATLASHSAVPVRVQAEIGERPEPAIETMGYFCAAELLTNVAKHSGARSAVAEVTTGGGLLRITVTDDGRGGARVGAGTGLSGLTERIGTVDGTMTVDSPAGGPTTVTIQLPLRAGKVV